MLIRDHAEGEARGDQKLKTSLVIAALCLISCGSRVSGTYVSHGQYNAELAQIVQIPNGQVQGTIDNLVRNGGQLNHNHVAFDGVTDGNKLTMTFHGPSWTSATLAATAGWNSLDSGDGQPARRGSYAEI